MSETTINASGGSYQGFTPRGPVSPSDDLSPADRMIPFIPFTLGSVGLLAAVVAIAAVAGSIH